MKFLFGKFALIAWLVLIFAGSAFAQTESEKGIELYLNGEYEKAVETLQKAVETDEKDRDAWLYLGMSFARLKKTGKAAKAFGKANKIDAKELADNEKAVKIISKPHTAYTDMARMNQVQGTIVVVVELGADGEVKFVFALRGLPDGLTENTINAARQIKFVPATRDGKPISVIKRLEYNFTIY